MVNVKKQVFDVLREWNGLTIDTIALLTGLSRAEIMPVITDLLTNRYLTYDDRGRISIRVVLNPTRRPFRAGLWDYETIGDRLQKGVTTIPDRYLDTRTIDGIVHRCQGKSPTCVGNAIAECADILYLRTTGDYPTPDDCAKCRNNVRLDPSDPRNSTYYDIHLPTSYSAICAYVGARQIGNVSGAGAYIDDAALYWKKTGLCRSLQWYLSKDGITQWWTPYPDKDPVTGETVAETQPKHRLGGFAAITTETGIKRALLDSGCVLIAYAVPENYLSWRDSGVLRWKGSCIGYHAGVIVGWDDPEQFWWILQTWRDEGFHKLMKMPYTYWSRAKDGAIALIPGQVAKFVRERIYRHITIVLSGVREDTDIEVQIGSSATSVGKAGGYGAELLLGETYTISARPKGADRWASVTVTVTETTGTVCIEWSGTPVPGGQDKPDVQRPPTLAERIRKQIADTLKNMFNRK